MTSFFDSWTLFGDAYLLALFAAAALSVVGVFVVARQEVFIGAAVAEASALGVAVGWYLTLKFGLGSGDGNGEEVVGAIGAIVFAVAAALWMMRGSDRHGDRLNGDERTAAVFIGCATLGVLLLNGLPQGRDQLERVQGGSMLGATPLDAVLAGGAAVLALALVVFKRRPLVLLLSDPVMASAVGMRVGRWQLLTALATGLVIGGSIRSTGFVFTFAALVLPALTAKQLVGQIGRVLWLAPTLGVTGVAVSLLLAHRLGLPNGYVAAATLIAGLVLARGYRAAAERFWLTQG